MKWLAAVAIGVLWLWLNAPTYDQLQHPAGEIAAIAIGLALIGGGLAGLLKETSR